jgi:short subunit dehydrogenase-like uncharacterized protein
MTAPRIGIYGATGHTGRLMAGELLARGEGVVLAGRNGEALHARRGCADPRRAA